MAEKTARDFTGIMPGVIPASAMKSECVEELVDLSTDVLQKAAIGNFRGTMIVCVRDGILEWLKSNGERLGLARWFDSKEGMDETLGDCDWSDIIDRIVGQVGSWPSLFEVVEQKYIFNGGVCFNEDIESDNFVYEQRLASDLVDAEDCLEVVMLGNDASQLTIHVLCSPFVAKRNACSPYCPDQLDITSPNEDGNLCYTIPPWYSGYNEETFLITKFEPLRRKHVEYVKYLVAIEQSLTQKGE